jgi:hydrogenase nickel incorporation protein HypA/HybF
MHELAITESLVDCIRENVGDARVVRVVVEIGRASGVAQSAVRACFEVCARGTVVEGAELEIVEPPGNELTIREVEVI